MLKDLAEQKAGLPEEYRTPGGIPIGTEDIRSEDILLPRLRIVQPTSLDSEDAMGEIRNSVTEETYEKIIVIPLTVRHGRILFPPEETHSGPICRSTDAIVSTEGQNCKECLKSHWGGEDGHEPPLCAETIDFPCLLEDGTMCALSLKRSAIKEAKKLISIVKFKNVPFFFLRLEVSTEKGEGQKGVYYVPKLKVIGETTNEERKRSLELCKFLQEREIKVDYEPHNEGEE